MIEILAKGTTVWVFCQEIREDPAKENKGYHAFPNAMLDRTHGSFRPRIGMSEGWVPAVFDFFISFNFFL